MSRWIKLYSVLNNSRLLFNTQSLKTRFLSNSHDTGMANSSTVNGFEGSTFSRECDGENEVENDGGRRPPFGTRYLSDPEKVFEHNAWDNMVWTEEQINAAKMKIEANSQNVLDDEKQEMFENEADKFWDEFYSKHQNKFFKDRNWLFKEFPELSTLDQPVQSSQPNKGLESHQTGAESGGEHVDEDQKTVVKENGRDDVQKGSSETLQLEQDNNTEFPCISTQDRTVNAEFPGAWCKRRFLEVGCGVGNTVFPILQVNDDPDLFVYCCDFSSVAIDLVKSNPEYNPERCHSFVLDITDTEPTLPFPEGSLDVIILIFVLSAVHPEKMQSAVNRLVSYLKPGGMILLRDYGKYDLAQLRFKPGRCLSDNFYVRGDGTRVYFFTQEELRTMFTTAGLTEEQNLIDRRLQVNRGRQITMYRVWIQCKYRKSGAFST